MAVVRTLCGQCAVGCGIRAVTGEGREVRIAGDPVHPANGGRLCPKSGAIADMVALDDRLLDPMLDGRRVGWDRAIGHIARRLTDIVARHGSDSVAMHVSGTLLTEDYYVANKLMKGFIGSAHIDTSFPAGKGMAAAYRAALGEDVVPGAYEDIDKADIILLVGAATAHRHPILLDRIQAARQAKDARLILLAAGDDGQDIEADLRLRVKPGSEAALLGGVLLHCHESGALAHDFIARHLVVPPDFWTALRPRHDLWSVARRCGPSPAEVRAFYDVLAAASRVVTVYGPGLADQEDGLPAAILNLHLVRGWIGKPGAAPMAIAAASNAMGAREVGCVSHELAAHRDFSPNSLMQVARFWGGRTMANQAGLHGGALVDAIADGRIKALWIVGGMPPAGHPLHAALAQVPLVILSTPWIDRDMQPQVVLPSPVWIEKDGTLTGADRLISRQRRLFPLPGAAKPDWWALTQVARVMGWRDAFHYERPADIYREHARLTAYQNRGERLLNLKRHAPISNPAYDELTPWRWGELPFDEGRFPTPDGRARLLPV